MQQVYEGSTSIFFSHLVRIFDIFLLSWALITSFLLFLLYFLLWYVFFNLIAVYKTFQIKQIFPSLNVHFPFC